jgi:hypothetical protein
MNHKIADVCRLILVLLVVLTAAHGLASGQVAGGWSAAPVTQEEVIAAANFAVQTQEKSIQQKTSDPKAKLELVAIQSAEVQVVAGMNTRLKLKVKLNDKEMTAEAVVWWQAWRNPDPYQLTAWVWH